MQRLLTLLTTAAILTPCGCTKSTKEPSTLSPTEATQSITALRGAYAAFNRGDIKQQCNPSIPKSSGPNLQSFPAVAPTTDAKR
jgi:hypothetical protein